MTLLDMALAGLAALAGIAALILYRRGAVPSQHAISFQTLCDVAPAGIWRTDGRGNAVYVNRAWLAMTGMTGDSWTGTAWTRAIHPEDRERVMHSWNTAVRATQRFRDEWRWLRPDGSSVWVTSLGSPEFDESGRLVGYVGLNIDIQRSKELETELHKARRRAEETTAAKTAFLANMSHEIRTPMNGVIGFTQLLLKTDLDHRQKAHVGLIAESGHAMMQLLNDILDLTKVESGQIEIFPEPTDIRKKIEHCLKLVDPVASQKDIRLETEFSDDLPLLVEADRLRLRQVLMNLLGNAAKFTQQGWIRTSAGIERLQGREWVAISVADTGIGIAPDQQARIFEPFTQEDGSVTRRYGGTGLGLSISNQLIQKMGGTIAVESEVGKGTRFTIRFPLRRCRSESPAISTEPTAPPADALAGLRLLVAEDHAINQQLVMSMMETLGVDARLVEDGEQAVRAVIEASRSGTPFQAVLMDVQMPNLDGLDATRELRAAGFSAEELPIIALTANCYADDIAACHAAGMQAHIGKPLNCSALASELRKVVGAVRLSSDPASMQSLASPELRQKYLDRRNALFDSLRRSLENPAPGTDWQELRKELHNIAGVAANFGDAHLGAVSRQLEGRIRASDDGHEHLLALRETWPEFQAAA